MAEGVIGTAIREGFSTGVAGESFTVDLAVYGVSTDFSSLVIFVEHGTEGDYDLVFTPAAADYYRARWTGNLSGAEFTQTWRVITILASQTVTISSPLTAAGNLDPIVAGDDYLNADGRAISWDVSGYPSLVGGTVTFTAIRAGAVRLTKALTIVDLNTVRLELTDTETGTLFVGRAYTYRVNALIGASDLLLASGSLVVT